MTKRLLTLFVASCVLAFLAPVQAGSAPLAAAVILAAVCTLGLVVRRAWRRRDDLRSSVAVELNKIRRIYHLGRNLGTETHHRQWFTELHGSVYAYLSEFDKKPFSRFRETDAGFRKLSYHLYQVSGLETEKERALYRELLGAAGAAAEARQRTWELWNGGLPSGAWTALTVLALASGAAALGAMGPSDRWTAAFAITAVGTCFFLAREADDLRHSAGEELAKSYAENVARLEMRREA